MSSTPTPRKNKLIFTKMINKAGKAVAPGSDTVQAAAASADWSSKPGFGVILANQPGDQSWPMAAATLDPDVQEAGEAG
jgi:phosphate transport system substrate-binding protein